MENIDEKCVIPKEREKCDSPVLILQILQDVIPDTEMRYSLPEEIVSEPGNEWIIVRREKIQRRETERYEKPSV